MTSSMVERFPYKEAVLGSIPRLSSYYWFIYKVFLKKLNKKLFYGWVLAQNER